MYRFERKDVNFFLGAEKTWEQERLVFGVSSRSTVFIRNNAGFDSLLPFFQIKFSTKKTSTDTNWLVYTYNSFQGLKTVLDWSVNMEAK